LGNRADKKLAVCGAVLVGISFAPALVDLSVNRPATPVSADTQVLIKDDQLILQGSINAELASKLRQVLGKPHEKISIVLLSSVGGDNEPAEIIADDLDKLGPRRTVVPSGSTCQSACILLATGIGNRFEPDKQATLMFHRSSIHLV